jgi:hypothetical protein
VSSGPTPPGSDEPELPLAGFWRKHWIKAAASIGLGALFVWIMHQGALPLLPDAAAFANVKWWAVVAYIALWCVVHAVRAGRWYWLLAAVHVVPLRRVIKVGFIGFGAILVLPFRAGEMVRPVLIGRAGKMSAWSATGTVAAERIIDGLTLTLILFVGLSLADTLDPLPDRIGDLPLPAAAVPSLTKAALALFVLAFATMAIFYYFRAWARRLTEAVVGVVSKRLARWFADRVEQLAMGFRFLPRARFTVPFAVSTLLYWCLNAVGTWFLAWACGFESISLSQACVIMGVLALGILVPNAPGFFGAFQISTYAGFAMFFSRELVLGPGAAYVFIVYLSQVGITLVAAAGALVLERLQSPTVSAGAAELPP